MADVIDRALVRNVACRAGGSRELEATSRAEPSRVSMEVYLGGTAGASIQVIVVHVIIPCICRTTEVLVVLHGDLMFIRRP
jgi:hypothetical protein